MSKISVGLCDKIEIGHRRKQHRKHQMEDTFLRFSIENGLGVEFSAFWGEVARWSADIIYVF